MKVKSQKISKETEQKKDKKITLTVWILVILLIAGWLFFTFYDGDFLFREEDRLDSLTLWIFIPFLILASLISLSAKSWGAFISTIIFCCCLIYPPMEGFIMFINVKIGKPTEQAISGTVIDIARSGNKIITLHYQIKTREGVQYRFETTWKGKVYKVNDQFNYTMKKGFFGVLYKDYDH